MKCRGLNNCFSDHVKALYTQNPFVDLSDVCKKYIAHFEDINKESGGEELRKLIANAKPSAPTNTTSSGIASGVDKNSDKSQQHSPPQLSAPNIPPFSFGGNSLISEPSQSFSGTQLPPPPHLQQRQESSDDAAVPKPLFGGLANTSFSVLGSSNANSPFSFSSVLGGGSSSASSSAASAKPLFSFSDATKSGGLPAGGGGTSSDVGGGGGGGEEDDDDAPKEEQIDPEKLMKGAGEENEETVQEVRAKAYMFNQDKKAWVDIGLGVFKLNKDKITGKSRLLLRADGSGRVLLNASMFAGMAPRLEADGKSVGFALVVNGKICKHLLKVKKEEAAQFVDGWIGLLPKE